MHSKLLIWTIEPSFVTSAPTHIPVDSTVRDLIDPETDSWDAGLVYACFPIPIAQAILTIPLRGREEQDRLVWRHSEDGRYTVKSGYRRWLAGFMQEKGIRPSGDAKLWKAIWTMRVPPKVRHFMWKFARAILPTGVKAAGRNPRWSDGCPFCSQTETQYHLFLECSWSCRVWRGTVWERVFTEHGDTCSMKWVEKVLKKESSDVVESWVMLLWAVWKERNAQLFNGLKWPEQEIVQRAMTILEDYRQNQGPEEAAPDSQPERRWTRPMEGYIKLNTDARIVANEGIGLGAVLRDHQGRFLAAAAKRVRGPYEVEMAEALAAEFGVQLAGQFRFRRLQLEVDSSTLVEKLSRSQEIHSEVGTICRRILSLLQETDSNPRSITHVRRTGNGAAHIMAHRETQWDNREVWLESPPIFLIDQVRLDDVTSSL
ncbi:unnamed protein product [Linum trigynum]|uniref:Reverse transcriptase zinc-binding domain-containing protein n=1 Tax=Linum trigynum TaxID=586398 RepID=A0AAV2GFD1_9ROSI